MPFLDASPYQQPPPQQANPLAMLSQMQQIQHQGMANQLLGSTMAGTQAQGEALAHNTDANGNLDSGAAMSELAGNPNGTYAMEEAHNNAIQMQANQFALGKSKIDFTNSQIAGFMTSTIDPTTGLPDPTKWTDKALAGVFGTITGAHGMSAADAADYLQKIVSLPLDQRVQAGIQALDQGLTTSQNLELAHGHLTMLTDGRTTTPTVTEQGTFQAAPAPFAMKTSPEFGQSRNPVTAADGSTSSVTNDAAKGQTLQTGIGPAQTAALGTSGTLGAQGEAQFSGQRSVAAQNNATFNLLQSEIPKAFTGTGAESQTSLARLGQALGFNGNTDKVTASESVTKALQKMINAQPNASNSDRQLAAQTAANPHQGLSQGGLTQMVAIAKGNNAQLEAVGNAWDKIKSNGAGSERFNEAKPLLDQRMPTNAFQYMALPLNMQHVITDGMSKTEYDNFMRTVSVGKKAGWLK